MLTTTLHGTYVFNTNLLLYLILIIYNFINRDVNGVVKWRYITVVLLAETYRICINNADEKQCNKI